MQDLFSVYFYQENTLSSACDCESHTWEGNEEEIVNLSHTRRAVTAVKSLLLINIIHAASSNIFLIYLN